ncbi:ATP-binding protein [Alteromonas sp. CYL-A6]|uniref:ATP-binding protein n=1 Tax=Alteromonas nitratireducens TaxID=3390813 RepID=UPI0034AED5F4
MNGLLRQLNPTRRLVGRVFLWFWLTCLITAVIAVVSARWLSEELSVAAAAPEDITSLNQVAAILEGKRAAYRPLDAILTRVSRTVRGNVVALDTQSGDIVRGMGPPLRPDDIRDLKQAASQRSPIALRRGIVRITGPVRADYDGREQALFLMRLDERPPHRPTLFVMIALAVVISAALSYWFARSLVRPLLTIQHATGELARGNWQSRVGNATKRKDEVGQLARDFNAMAAQLESMWQAQQRLLADISHELRSPLARLQMGLGIAHQKKVDPQLLERIEREADRMESLIAQLLTLSRTEAGALRRQTVGLSALCEDWLQDAQFEAKGQDKALTMAPIPERAVRVDPELCVRALENVVRNAIHYATQHVHVHVAVCDRYWEMQVCDDGPGLTREECGKIFAPFYRTSDARERESGGVGLGLSIAKAAIEMHHGSIHAEPLGEGGLKVTMRFPLDDTDDELDADNGTPT